MSPTVSLVTVTIVTVPARDWVEHWKHFDMPFHQPEQTFRRVHALDHDGREWIQYLPHERTTQ
jgi:hypothetical protein